MMFHARSLPSSAFGLWLCLWCFVVVRTCRKATREHGSDGIDHTISNAFKFNITANKSFSRTQMNFHFTIDKSELSADKCLYGLRGDAM